MTPPSKNLRILLVEDEAMNLEVLQEFLTDLRHQVHATPDGETALALAQDLPSLDLLITDVRMPGIDGLELARRVTAQHESVRVVIITGYAEEALPQPGDHGRRWSILRKPFPLASLASLVEESAPGS